MKGRRLLLTCCIVLAGALLFGDRGEPAKPPETIKLGFIGPMTGARATYGSFIYGAEAIVDHINQTGGIKSMGGAKIELVWGDSASDAATFASEIERVITSRLYKVRS